jgi:hypothetical protein
LVIIIYGCEFIDKELQKRHVHCCSLGRCSSNRKIEKQKIISSVLKN